MHPSKECEEFLNCRGFQICMRDYQMDEGSLIIPSLFGYSPGSIVIGLKILFIGEKLSSLNCARQVMIICDIHRETKRTG
ncbi:hypothetical protein I7I48_03651 [Histoplasma ohiense]|nr:hypothetical protein I7I48_03651 [Histoplasma ohiense (nom. inval.)]